MMRFLFKTCLFLSSLLIIFTFPFFVVYISREYVSPKEAVEVQSTFPEALFGLLYHSNLDYLYKKDLIQTKHPKIIAIGSSKVMEIRKEFFLKPDEFVNAGIPIGDTSIGTMEHLIEGLKGSDLPNVIILGIDQDLLYEKYEDKSDIRNPSLFTRIGDLALYTSRNIYLDALAKKYSIRNLFSLHERSPNMGINALIHGDGYRADGSYRYHNAEVNKNLANQVALQTEAQVKDIKATNIEAHKEELASNLAALERIVRFCKENNITLIGFMPPYPKPIYEAMNTQDVRKDMLTAVPEDVNAIFSRYQFPLFNFSSTDSFGGENDTFIDTLHGTDVMYVHMMLAIASRTHTLDRYLNVQALNAMAKTKGSFLPF